MTDSSPYTNYERWVRRLYETNMFHPVKMGLSNIEALHAALGAPMDRRMVIHIAGTNGKGSVALKIANTLQKQSSLKVGLFCSPHISTFRERMQVNGEFISEQEVVQLLPRIYELCRVHDIPATFFEITTALAFSFYDARACDVVVLETGLGGRLDATNVVKKPALSVITSIGLEHTRILGDTVELIALEKGGIIKKECPVLVGPNVPHTVLRQCAREKEASAYYTCEDVLQHPTTTSNNDVCDYDAENTRIATAALKLVQKSHKNVIGEFSDELIEQGTAVRPPCRFEEVSVNGQQVILDVAHNPPAMQHLAHKLHQTYPRASFRLVVGMSSDKDLSQCSEAVRTIVNGDESRVHLVEAAHPRAAKVATMAGEFLKGANYDLQDPSITKQVRLALKKSTSASDKNEILVVCGSVFVMSEAREALGFDEPRDTKYIAEMAGAGVRHGQENFGNTTTAMP